MKTATGYSHVGTLIVGAGQAGSESAMTLRRLGYAKRIVLIGEESFLPYRRPPLSKTFLSGEATLESLYLRPGALYEKHAIECMTGVRVDSIDRDAHTVAMSTGEVLVYENLVLATGGRPRRLALPGADLPNVHYLRTVEDILRLKEQFQQTKRLVIIGGGYIGLETAAIGIKKGLKVAIVEALPRVLARVTSPEVSAFYEHAHRQRGVDLYTDATITSLEGDGRVETVVLADGTRIPADLVVVGVGLIPNTELAEAAGLETNNGILVDAYARTSDASIYAIGDCSNHKNIFVGRQLRLESVSNAIDQARVSAAAIVGEPVAYDTAPWFWSDQYDLKLQTVGLSHGYDQLILRGNLHEERFIVFYLSDGVVIAADAVNCPQDFVIAKKLVAERTQADTKLLADQTCPLETHQRPRVQTGRETACATQ